MRFFSVPGISRAASFRKIFFSNRTAGRKKICAESDLFSQGLNRKSDFGQNRIFAKAKKRFFRNDSAFCERASVVRSLVLVSVLFALAACGSSGNKIGSTVKGTRISIVEMAKQATPDSDVPNHKPELPEPAANQNWPQAGYDPTHVMPNAALADQPKEIWSADMGQGSDSDFKLLARPVINNGSVFTMDSHGLVTALDARDGSAKWSFDTTPPDAEDGAIAGGIAADGEAVYATTGFGDVVALDAHNGHELWRRALQNPLRAAPTVADGNVYAVSIDNQLSVLRASTGEPAMKARGSTPPGILMRIICTPGCFWP